MEVTQRRPWPVSAGLSQNVLCCLCCLLTSNSSRHPSSPRLHFHGFKLSVSQDSLFYKVKSWDDFAPWPESQFLFADGHSDTFKSRLWNKHFHSDNVSWPMEKNESRVVNGSYSSSVTFLQRSEKSWNDLEELPNHLASLSPAAPTATGSSPAFQ